MTFHVGPPPAGLSPEMPNTRLLLRVESLDADGLPLGNPVWLRGVAQLHPDDRGAMSLQWVADDRGMFYELSREELEP